ncbi:hypothetical protein LK996_07040 [Lysobacter sp. A6]|uniref:Hemolysin XhlA n=1 Tax=Noviluteimonas lactosilytica TaxID=2888523 RepID=A0ABS8JGW0_9GAMM|nr:hypothetical protein [Lysobacter lactosilyticus]MCC8362831.1 hypothetical protein [Lysobacter lactosilyticus]
MIERLAKLEQRLDSVLPTLCTKADMESVRADVHRGISEMHRGISEMHRGLGDMKKWMIATIFALLIGLFTIGNFMWNGIRTMA